MLRYFLFLTGCFSVAASPAQSSLEDFLSQQGIKTQSSTEGLHYVIHDPGVGVYPKGGNYVMIRFSASLLNGNIFDKSEEDEPFLFQVGNREVILGLDYAVQLLKAGGKGTFYLPAVLGYGQKGVGEIVPPGSPLVYEVELVQIMDFEEYDDYMRKLEEQERREHEYEKQLIFQRDLATIATYVKNNHLSVSALPSGLSYAIVAKGNGRFAQSGDRLKVQYEGFLADGSPIESPSEKKTYEFFLGNGTVMKGWEEGLRYFNKGAEGWLLIPSALAYGQLSIKEGNIHIPKNSTLIFRVCLLDIIEN